MSRPLLAALVDDAALFPPGNVPMPAVAAHRRHRAAPHGELVGRYLCPASRLDELRAAAHAATTDGDVHSTLSEEDGAALAAVTRAIPPDEALRTRERYAGYGSRSIDEPVAELATLGVWAGDAR